MEVCALARPFPSFFFPSAARYRVCFYFSFLYPHHLDTTVVIAAFLIPHARRIGRSCVLGTIGHPRVRLDDHPSVYLSSRATRPFLDDLHNHITNIAHIHTTHSPSGVYPVPFTRSSRCCTALLPYSLCHPHVRHFPQEIYIWHIISADSFPELERQ
jgi:hypothetical protein